MIRSEAEYKEARQRLEDEKKRLLNQEKKLKSLGLKEEEIKNVMDPLLSFHLQLEEEIDYYEKLRRGQIDPFTNLHDLGRLLIALRIAKGIPQRELALKLGVHETQISRDEKNEYSGVSIERAAKILDCLGVRLQSRFTEPLFDEESVYFEGSKKAKTG